MTKENEEPNEDPNKEGGDTSNTEETQGVDESKFQSAGDDSVYKLDMSAHSSGGDEEETPQSEADKDPAEETDPPKEEEENNSEEAEENPPSEPAPNSESPKPEESVSEIPENIQKLMNFMEETGGDMNDYIKLNQDFSSAEDNEVLRAYYKDTKKHLTNDEISFLLEDQFHYDEDLDDDRDIRRKQLALKEEVAVAKKYLDTQKTTYYEEIKAGSKLTEEQQKAIDFFNRYNKESNDIKEKSKQNSDIFTSKTKQVFNDEFKGFEFNVGEKKYHYNVKNAEEVMTQQSDINNFTKKFLDKKMALVDAHGYHKALYTATNADAIAKHFYEQGKADAMKNSVEKAKNINMSPRQSHSEGIQAGFKARVIGEDTQSFKFKIKNKK